MKKLWIGGVVCGGLIAGISLTYARIIPGVDEPYNPAAYYSSTDISYADSPSTFFYRDLARGGNIVYDPERHKNNILSCLKYDEILKTVQEVFRKKEEDKTPYRDGGITSGLQQVQQKTASLNLAKSIAEKSEQVFPNANLTEEEFNSRTQEQQIKFLNDMYRQVASNAQQSIQNSLERQRLMEIAIQRSNNAQGTVQAEQARMEIEALIQEEFNERNMIWDNFSAMYAATNQYKVNKEMVNARNVMDAKSQSGFSDPYHLDAYEKKLIEKSDPLGLPDF